MPRYDITPTSEEEVKLLIRECVKVAADEGIQLTFIEGGIPGEFTYMDVAQLMSFRDVETHADRMDVFNFAKYVDHSCYLKNNGFNNKLNRLDFVFLRKDNGSQYTMHDWIKSGRP